MFTSKSALTWGFVLLLFGAGVLALMDDGVPDRTRLVELKGKVHSLETSMSKGGGLAALRFALSTDPRYFSYHSSAGDIDAVWRALHQAGQREVRILVDPADSHSPAFEERAFYAVLEVAVQEKTVRHYSEVVASLRSNSLVGAALGYGAVALGAAFLVGGFLRRRG